MIAKNEGMKVYDCNREKNVRDQQRKYRELLKEHEKRKAEAKQKAGGEQEEHADDDGEFDDLL